MAQDFIKQEIVLGDWVIFTRSSTRRMLAGQIVSVGNKMVTVKHKHLHPGPDVEEYQTSRAYFCDVCKVTGEDILVKILAGDYI